MPVSASPLAALASAVAVLALSKAPLAALSFDWSRFFTVSSSLKNPKRPELS